MDTEAIKWSLEGCGLRCTPQRHPVTAFFLMEHNRHSTAAEIFDAVNRAIPRECELIYRGLYISALRDTLPIGCRRRVDTRGMPWPAAIARMGNQHGFVVRHSFFN